MKKIIDWIKSPKSDFVLFVILLVLANIVGHNAFLRFDLTEPKSYSISKSSKQIVKTLEEPLSIKVFFDDSLPSPYNSYYQYIKDLLEEYKGSAGRNFSISYLDMKKEDNQRLASDFGLRQIQIQEVKNNEVGFKQVYMGLVFTYGDAVEKLDAVTSIDGLEYKITSTISQMVSKVDTLSGLGKGNKIKITLFLSSSLKNLRISGIDQVEAFVNEAYKNVNKQSMDRVEFEVVNPLSSEVNELAERYGVQTVTFTNSSKQQEKAIFGLTISLEDEFRVLPLSIERSFFGNGVAGLESLEDNMNSGIQNLLSKTTQIGFVVGHYEHKLEDENDSANFISIIENAGYEPVQLDLMSEEIPAGMSTIILDGPQQDYMEEELYKIDQFLMKGGNVLFFVDPMFAQGGNQYQMPSYYPLNLNVDTLLNAYGVKREQNFVFDKQCHTQANQNYGKLNYHWVPVVQKKNLAKHNPITNNLGYVYMLSNGVIDASEAKENKDLKTTVLVRSSSESWVEDHDIMLNPIMLVPPKDAEFKSYDLAVMLEGKFNSAFDSEVAKTIFDEEGNPVEVDTSNDDLSASGHIMKSRVPGKVFVVGSSQITTVQLLDKNSTSPIAMFLVNVLDYVNGREELCTMRTKGLALNTLEIKSQALAQVLKYFCIYGLVVLVVVAGFVALRLRAKHRIAIRKRYNPDDTREIVRDSERKNKKAKKSAKDGE
ncbi:MAG: Gldg family protein [Treponema sp.]|nr:Gldg family protein [Treponema sp.]